MIKDGEKSVCESDQNMALKNVNKKHTGYFERYLSTKICLYDLGRFLNTWVNHLCLTVHSLGRKNRAKKNTLNHNIGV